MKKNKSCLARLFYICCLTASFFVSTAGADEQAASKAIGIETVKAADYVGSSRYALVIGIDNYQDEKIPKLKTCETDANSMYELLTDPQKGGVNKQNAYLLLGQEATTRNIKKYLSKLRQIPAKSTVFIFYSGHGAKEAEKAYWVTQDAEIDYLSASAMSELEIRSFLSDIPSDRVVVMLDCCYAAATVKGGKSSVSDFGEVLRQFTGKGRAYLMAAGSGEEAIEAQDLKQSVFSHYLLEGLGGKADQNADGVVVLTELSTYVDSHVADEARVRGGIQRPVVEMEEVSEPSKFGLTIDAQKIQDNMLERAHLTELFKQRLAKAKQLYLDEKVSLENFKYFEDLLNRQSQDLNDTDRQRLGIFIQVLDGELPVEKLQRAFDAIGTPEQRAARLAEEARRQAEQERQSKIARLLSYASTNDNKENGKEALKALDELLSLDSSNSEARELRNKIAGYFASAGDIRINSIGMKLIYIPAGEFMMGSPSSESERGSDEGPQHRVKISKGFYMGIYEVTQTQYQSVMGTNPSRIKGDNLPVEQVSWDDATEFCRKLSQKEGKTYRLPTEAEWEYACRAGTTTRFCFGDSDSSLVDYGWYLSNSNNQTHSVGQKKPNAFGLYDMQGNVWEWCRDWYSRNYYSNSPEVDPLGPSSGQYRVLRGGCWDGYPMLCRSAHRDWNSPFSQLYYFGFRIVVLDF